MKSDRRTTTTTRRRTSKSEPPSSILGPSATPETDPRAPSTAGGASIRDHAQNTVRRNHAQETGHGPGEYLALMPTCETPGFDWVSARASHVWLALFDHARRCGIWVYPKHVSAAEANADNDTDVANWIGLGAQWTVDLLARTCGIGRNAAGAALKELVDLSWLRKSMKRHSGGQFTGFVYVLMPPPHILSEAAQHDTERRSTQKSKKSRSWRKRCAELSRTTARKRRKRKQKRRRQRQRKNCWGHVPRSPNGNRGASGVKGEGRSRRPTNSQRQSLTR